MDIDKESGNLVIYLVVQRHEDEGTVAGNVEAAFLSKAEADRYVEEWEYNHEDDYSGQEHSFQGPEEEDPEDGWCWACREDRIVEKVTLSGSTAIANLYKAAVRWKGEMGIDHTKAWADEAKELAEMIHNLEQKERADLANAFTKGVTA